MPTSNNLRRLLLVPAVLLAGWLSGCGSVIMNPSGDIAAQQSHLIVVSTVLMLLIVVPVIALVVIFAWRYRQSNSDAGGAIYSPDWAHSTQLELVIWSAPLLIIIALGAVTWISTHTLDPYRALRRLDANRPVGAGTKPLVVEVVALDWKWLFIYPELGIATVNELAAPVDQPISFKITASSVMNSFFIPALAGQIYAMPGMQTQMHAVINKPGVFDGFSANYSGAGFSGMRFKFHGLSPAEFDLWVEKAKASGQSLGREAYLQLEKPSQRDPIKRYAVVAPDLYDAILDRCVDSSKMCMHQMAAIDAGGLGSVAGYAVARQRWSPGRGDAPALPYVKAMVCTTDDPAPQIVSQLEPLSLKP